MKKQIILFSALIVLITASPAFPTEFSESFTTSGDHPQYSFDTRLFGPGGAWPTSWVATGGILNGAFHRVSPNSNGESSCYFGLFNSDTDFYMRGCWRMSSGWDADMKLSYNYTVAGNVNVFLHSGSAESDWNEGYTEPAVYLVVTDGWYHANSAENIVRHTNYFNIEDHWAEWWSVEHLCDVNQNPNVHKLWITTEWGAANLSDGACGVNGSGKMHFNNYLYLHISIATAATTMDGDYPIKVGAYTNGSGISGSTMDQDEISFSTSKIGHPFDGEEEVPTKVQGLSIFGGSLR